MVLYIYWGSLQAFGCPLCFDSYPLEASIYRGRWTALGYLFVFSSLNEKLTSGRTFLGNNKREGKLGTSTTHGWSMIFRSHLPGSSWPMACNRSSDRAEKTTRAGNWWRVRSGCCECQRPHSIGGACLQVFGCIIRCLVLKGKEWMLTMERLGITTWCKPCGISMCKDASALGLFVLHSSIKIWENPGWAHCLYLRCWAKGGVEKQDYINKRPCARLR